MKRFVIAIAACSLAVSLAVHAGTRMTFATGEGEVSRFSIKGDRIRMEGGSDGDAITLFDASEERLTVIEPFEQRYYQMDAETMRRQGERVSQQMQALRRQMEQQMENMPEEQREKMRQQMERMMPDNAGRQKPVNLRVERGGGHASVAGVRCEKVTVYGDDRPLHQACVASADSLGMSRSDMATMQSLFGMLDEMAVGFGGDRASAQAPAKLVEEMNGIPIQARDVEGGAEWMLQDVRSDDLDAGDFEIPAGYQQVDPFSTGQVQ